MKAGNRADIEQAAAVADQLVGEPQRQIGQGADVDRDHVELIGAIALDRPAEQAEAGIVDDILHFQAGRGQRFGNPVAGIGLHEVAGNDDRSRAARGRDFSRQRLQAIGAPRHQRQTMAVGCKNARQFGAYARRCTGNQRHTFGHDQMLLNQLEIAASSEREHRRVV